MAAAKKAEAKRGVGRPRLEDGRRKTLSTRVTETELGMCVGAAEANGETVSDWLRRVAIRVASGGGGKL